MAGDGEVEQVRARVAERGLEDRVAVLGWVDGEKKLELLRNAAAVVLPSYHEGLPMAILEGMAAGKAIISTTVGAIPEVVTGGNGTLVEPGDVIALAQALLQYGGNGRRSGAYPPAAGRGWRRCSACRKCTEGWRSTTARRRERGRGNGADQRGGAGV